MRKYDDDFNKDARRIVKNFNQRVRRAKARGEKDVPELRSLRQMKMEYTTKRDLKNELSDLKSFIGNKQALQRRATKDGTIPNWEYDYIIKNLRVTDKWLAREIGKQKAILKDYPDHLYATREKLNKLEDERRIIHQNLDDLTARQLKIVGAVIGRYKTRNRKTIAGRNYFMRNLDLLLTAQGNSKSERQKIYDQLNKLTNEEFEELYYRHDVISEIMVLFDSPTDGEDEKSRFKRAEQAIKDQNVNLTLVTFNENLGEYVMEAKKAVADNRKMFDASRQKWVSYEEYEKIAKKLSKGGK